MHRQTPPVAGLAALVASGPGHPAGAVRQPDGPVQSLQRRRRRWAILRAGGTDQSHQALRQDADHGRRHHERLDPQVDEARDGRRCVIGVQRGQDQVAGLRRLQGDSGRLLIADLADQHDVRILAQDRAQPRGERHPGPRVDLDLVDPLQLVLDRVFDRDDVLDRRFDPVQRRVQGRGLAAAGRAGHQDHPLRSRQEILEPLQEIGGEAQLTHIGARAGAVEEADDHLLAKVGRQGGDAQIDFPLLHAQAAAAVLRLAPLGDIHPRDDLQPRHHGRLQMLRNLQDVPQHPVHALPDLKPALLRLDVDVAGAGLRGIGEDQVHQAHDRRQLHALRQLRRVHDLVLVVVGGLELAFGGHRRDQVVRRSSLIQLGVETLQHPEDRRLGGRHCGHPSAGTELDVLERSEVERIAHGQPQGAILDAERKHLPLAAELRRETEVRFGGRLDLVQIDVLETQAPGDGARHRIFGGQTEVDDDAAERPAIARLDLEGARQPVGVHDARLHQNVLDRRPLHRVTFPEEHRIGTKHSCRSAWMQAQLVCRQYSRGGGGVHRRREPRAEDRCEGVGRDYGSVVEPPGTQRMSARPASLARRAITNSRSERRFK